jgi:eukaryotic-like serine/threonine-protein kinase
VPLSAGSHLGPYEVVSLLGAGGTGEVYQARDTRLDRLVAIKIVASGIDDPTVRERLMREARAASALNHPHICTIHDVGEQDGRPFIAMEWIDGETLAACLSRSAGALPIDDTLRLATQIADALDAAHASGIVHRDLKPANLFITRRTRPNTPMN